MKEVLNVLKYVGITFGYIIICIVMFLICGIGESAGNELWKKIRNKKHSN